VTKAIALQHPQNVQEGVGLGVFKMEGVKINN
jgi:hypothetical protein